MGQSPEVALSKSIGITPTIMSNSTPDLTPFLRPHVSGLSSLFKKIPCFIVRMHRFDDVENRGMHGEMIWPEVLVCMNHEAAEVFKDYLNIKSYQDSREMWLDGDPELSEQEIRHRWEDEEVAQYVVEIIEDLSQYAELQRLPESIRVAKGLFSELLIDQ